MGDKVIVRNVEKVRTVYRDRPVYVPLPDQSGGDVDIFGSIFGVLIGLFVLFFVICGSLSLLLALMGYSPPPPPY